MPQKPSSQHSARSKSYRSNNSNSKHSGYYYPDLDPEDIAYEPKGFNPSKSSHSSSSDRYNRAKPAHIRPKFERVHWDGMHATFTTFMRYVEGHLLQVGAGYLTSPSFVQSYRNNQSKFFTTDLFWQTYKISQPQAIYDKHYLYGIIMTATRDMQNKTVLRYEDSQDGILAWDDFKHDFAYDGSKELRLEQLESQTLKPYRSNTPGGMAAYIDKFQSYIAELEVLAPFDYTDARKKRSLLANIRDAEGVSHLIQKCRDDTLFTYEMCAAYLRKNAILIDHDNLKKTPRRLLSTKDDRQVEPSPTMSLEEATNLFHSIATEEGITTT
jgi:hypothetical protein